MDFKDKIEAIKKLLGFAEAAPAAEPAPAPADNSAKSKDGTEVRWQGDMKEGAECYVVTAEGTVPAPDGAIELEDGTVLTISGGKISGITKSAAPEVSQDMNKFETMVSDLKTEFNSATDLLKSENENLKKELQDLKLAFKNTVEIVEMINTTPAETTPAPVTTFAKNVEDKQKHFEELAQAIKQLHKK